MSEETNLPAVRSPEVQQVRQQGQRALAVKREINALAKAIEGMEWGGGTGVVKGSSFSIQTRYMIAEFCRITGANPMTQVDILGGKPYLNVNFWTDRVTNDPYYVDHEVRDISASVEENYRAQSDSYRQKARERKAEGDEAGARVAFQRAAVLEEKADYCADARSVWNPPAWASNVVEVEIRRYQNAAPVDQIRAGDIPPDEAQKWVVSVKEANWAGNRPLAKKRDGGGYQSDPVGEAEPEKTSRSRAFRRCASRAFPAWAKEWDSTVEEAQRVIDADWEIIQEEPTVRPGVVSTSGGEAEAAVDGPPAREVPRRGEILQEVRREPEPEPVVDVDSFDANDARKRLFATLRDAGIAANDDRKQWATDNGLPASTSNWGKAEYDRAHELLVGETRDEVLGLAASSGVDLGDLSLQVLGKAEPSYLKDFQALLAVLAARSGNPAAPAEEGDL